MSFLRSALLPILLLCCSPGLTAQVMTKLDQRASVSMPALTQAGSSQERPLWFFTFEQDPASNGMVMILDGRTYNLDSAAIARNYDQAGFIQSLVDGMFGNAAGLQEVSRKKIQGPHFKGYEFEFRNHSPSERYPHTRMFLQINFAGHTVYALGAYGSAGEAIVRIKTQFFSSFQIH